MGLIMTENPPSWYLLGAWCKRHQRNEFESDRFATIEEAQEYGRNNLPPKCVSGEKVTAWNIVPVFLA